MSNRFSRKVTVFHGRTLPEEGFLAGYSLLISEIKSKLDIMVPLPDTLSIATEKHQRYNTDQWQVFTIRYKPKDDLKSHLVFALKYKPLDLAMFNAY